MPELAKPDMASLVAHALREDHDHSMTTMTKSSSDADPTSIEDGPASEAAPAAPDPREASLPHDFDVGIEDLPEIKRAWTGAFVDGNVERLYRKEAFYPNLGRCMSHVLMWFAAFNCLSFISLSAHGVGDTLSTERHGWSANLLLVVLVLQIAFIFRTAHFCNLPMWLMEALSVTTLVSMALLLRYHQLLLVSTVCAPRVTLMLRLGAFLVLTSAYVPLTTWYYFAVLIISVAVGGALDIVADPSADDMMGACPYTFGSLVMLALSTAVCRCRLASVARGEWAFRRTVIQAQRERKRVHRAFEKARAAKLKLVHGREKEKQRVQLEVQSARSRLIRVVMHGMRSPLLSVSSATKMLHTLGRQTPLGDERVAKSLDALSTCALMLENIVRDMLDFERIESGRVALMFEPFTIGKVLEDAHTTFEALAREKGVHLVRAALDEQLERSVWLGDSWRLQQCLNNGVSNAIKFTDPGGSVYFKAWLSFRNERAAEGLEKVHIAVVDDGIGLTPQEIGKLNNSESFSVLGLGTAHGRGGTGLGLCITRSLLKLHNDSVLKISSMGEGRGTTFEMQLSLKPTSVGAQHPALSPQASSRPSWASARSSVGGTSVAGSIARSSGPRSVSGTSVAGSIARSSGPPSPVNTKRAAPPGFSLSSARPASEAASEEPPAEALPMRDSAELTTIDHSLSSSRAEPSPLTFHPDFCCLHVEDDVFLQMTLPAVTFDPLGAPYQTAKDGQHAIELVVERAKEGLPPFGLIIMDNQMPRMNGIRAVRELRARGHEGLIVGVTGEPAGSPERAEFEAAGLSSCTDKDTGGMEVIIGWIRSFAVTAAPESEVPPHG